MLRKLAQRAGILLEYVDASGSQRRITSDETLIALLDAMGLDGSSEHAATATLRRLEQQENHQVLPPACVLRPVGHGGLHARFRIPDDLSGPIDWSAKISSETGRMHIMEGRLSGRGRMRFVRVSLPKCLLAGYHELRVWIRGSQSEVRADQLLVLAPSKCYSVADRLGDRRAFGVCANLYTITSRRNWGIGDFTDLAAVSRWCAKEGGAFVGVNPLHATPNRNGQVSPYSPISRLFRNIVYLDIEAIPEFRTAPGARKLVESSAFRSELARVRNSVSVDYERVASLKLCVLRRMHEHFSRQLARRSTSRAGVYARFVASQGDLLTDFATFCALSEHFERRTEGRIDWRAWPASYHHPRAKAVERFRRVHAEDVDFHRYLQFEMERQLARVTRSAHSAGLKLGLYQDLAIGSMPGGFDSWAFSGLFVADATVGAPPDSFSSNGQDWGLPPLSPHHLQRDRYNYWISLLRSNLSQTGALRIDHIMGLQRLFWIPKGCTPSSGAYVAYPSHKLMAILALESVRARAVIIGEDLGTVPRNFSRLLARYGILSSQVLYFQQNKKGGFLPSRSYSKRAFVTANTHDHVPLAGYWIGRDLELYNELGLNPKGKDLQTQRRKREEKRKALLRRLHREGAMQPGETGTLYATLGRAVHRFLCNTPSPLVGLMLDDIVGETEPVNVPSVGMDRYLSWTRRMKLPVEEFPANSTARETMNGAKARRMKR